MNGSQSEHLLGIGAFAELTGLSIDALRHYHELGLLEPRSVDPRTAYRRYALAQVPRARLIARLRRLDMPLDDIRVVLESPDESLAVLLEHRRRLTLLMREAAERVDDLDRLIEEGGVMGTSTVDEALRGELLAMFDEQQAIGRALFEHTRTKRPDRYLFELPEEDRPSGWRDAAKRARRHARRLAEIVTVHGWPGRSIVGDEGAAAAWAIAQHADEDNDRRRRWLPLLADAVARGEAAAFHYAALADRVALRDGQPQRFGTLVEPDGSTWRLRGPADPTSIDEARSRLGLGTVDEFLRSLPVPDVWYSSEETTGR